MPEYTQWRTQLKRFSKYILVGGGAALVDFIVFVSLLALMKHGVQTAVFTASVPAITWANTTGILCGFFWSFFWQRRWVFASKGSASLQLALTAGLLLFNIVITNLAIPLLTNSWMIPVEWSKILLQIAVVCWNFFIYQYLIFRATGS